MNSAGMSYLQKKHNLNDNLCRLIFVPALFAGAEAMVVITIRWQKIRYRCKYLPPRYTNGWFQDACRQNKFINGYLSLICLFEESSLQE